jgi:hypothetical protein
MSRTDRACDRNDGARELPACLLEWADELEGPATSVRPIAMPGQPSQGSNEEDWIIATPTSAVHAPVRR